MKAALQAAGGRLLYAVKCFWPTLSSFPISADKTGADLADGCDKIKPPPRRMNAGAHAFFFFDLRGCLPGQTAAQLKHFEFGGALIHFSIL